MKEYFFEDKKIFYKKNDFLAGRPTLVFVHGLSGSSSAWIKYENQFKGKYNLLTFDLRGHGKSIRPKKYQDYEMKYFAQDLFELLNFLEIKKCTLISHSLGTIIAFEFILNYEYLADSAIFLSPSFNVQGRKEAKFIKPLLAITKVIELLPRIKKTGKQVDYDQYQNTGDWNLRRTIADVNNTGVRSYLFSTKQTYNVNYENLLEKINIPILIIHGNKDTIFPHSNSIKMADKIKKSELIILNNTDHIIVLNNFSEVSSAIEKFVDKLF